MDDELEGMPGYLLLLLVFENYYQFGLPLLQQQIMHVAGQAQLYLIVVDGGTHFRVFDVKNAFSLGWRGRNGVQDLNVGLVEE